MLAALLTLPLLFIGGALGLIGICAAMRAGQCSQHLESSPHLAVPAPPPELRRAA